MTKPRVALEFRFEIGYLRNDNILHSYNMNQSSSPQRLSQSALPDRRLGLGGLSLPAKCLAATLVFAMCGLSFTPRARSQYIAPTLAAPTSAKLKTVNLNAPLASLSAHDARYRLLAEEASAMTRQHSLLKKLVKTVGPSVAHIEAKKRQKANATSSGSSNARRPVVIEEAGSGIVIEYRKRFYVVTNFHVIEDAGVGDIQIEVAGRLYFPSRLFHDRETDLSVIALSKTDLTPCRVGNSDNVEIGDFAVAVGSPFGLSHSVSYGIISAMNRHDLDLGPQGVRYQNFMQTDAAINPGNSGGPLINLRGEIIGINTAIASNSGGNDGIGFSIPINMAMRVVTDLIEHGTVQRGFLGVSLDASYGYEKSRNLGLNVAYGALVSAVTPSSPAYKSDIRVGDVILEFDGKRVNNDSQLVTKVSLARIDAQVPVKLFRRGEMKTVQVAVRNRSQFSPKN
ncbi:MAG: serine protease Do [Mariniblastus sp.]|jgi:serine protease Do